MTQTVPSQPPDREGGGADGWLSTLADALVRAIQAPTGVEYRRLLLLLAVVSVGACGVGAVMLIIRG